MTAKAGRASARSALSDRFQEAIDAAAMSAGLIGTDEYLAEWRRESRPCGEELEAEVSAAAAQLEQAYGADRLEQLARASGKEPR